MNSFPVLSLPIHPGSIPPLRPYVFMAQCLINYAQGERYLSYLTDDEGKSFVRILGNMHSWHTSRRISLIRYFTVNYVYTDEGATG
jgi:hypothetical protein